MDRPRIPIVMAVGDTVHARNGEGPQLVATDLVVSAINGTVVTGASELLGDLDSDAGWEFEVTRKGTVSLPARLSEIAVVFATAPITPVKLLGRGADWQQDGGARIAPDELVGILGWMDWDDWTDLLAPYLVWKTEQDQAALEAGHVSFDSAVV